MPPFSAARSTGGDAAGHPEICDWHSREVTYVVVSQTAGSARPLRLRRNLAIAPFAVSIQMRRYGPFILPSEDRLGRLGRAVRQETVASHDKEVGCFFTAVGRSAV